MTNATFIIGICIALLLGFGIAYLLLRYSGLSIIKKAREEAEMIKRAIQMPIINVALVIF